MTAFPESRRPQVADIDRRIRSLPSWLDVLGSPAPEWYGRLLTSYCLLTDNEPVVYLTGSMERDGEHLVGYLVSFTEHLLVRAKVWGSTDVKMSASSVSRGGLVQLGVSGSTAVDDADAPLPWPGNLTFTLTYRSEADALALPLDIPDDPDWQAEQAALLAGLRSDLVAP